ATRRNGGDRSKYARVFRPYRGRIPTFVPWPSLWTRPDAGVRGLHREPGSRLVRRGERLVGLPEPEETGSSDRSGHQREVVTPRCALGSAGALPSIKKPLS